MESKEKGENNIINDEAPPVINESFQNNNNINNNPNLKNINNNINLEESNFNLFPNVANENKKKEQNKNISLNKSNYPKLQYPVFYVNPYLLQNQMNQQYLMRLNYMNQMQKKNINNIKNIYMPYNNINNSDNNYYDLSIDINTNIIKKFDKENLIDIILFIRDFCQVKIEQKFIGFCHNLFQIRKKKGKYLFSIKKKMKKLFSNNQDKDKNKNIININNNINKNEDDNNNSDSDENEENDNIINNNSKKNIGNIEKDNSNFIFCELHQKLYLIDDYKEHLNSHQKCQNCGMEFKTKKILSLHMKKVHLNNNQIIINNQNKKEDLMKNNLNQNINSDNIKCTECDKIFDSVESMSAHYYDIHEKKLNLKVQNNNKKEENKKENIFKISNENNIKEKLILPEELRKLEEENKRKKLIDEIEMEVNHKKEKFERENNYYECYHDKKIFKTEKEYVSHFKKYHEYDFPFYCETCDKGFYSQKSIIAHFRKIDH